MTNHILNVFLQRFILPIIILICMMSRPSLFSVMYLLILLYIPWVPIVNITNIDGSPGWLWKFLVTFATLALLSHVVFQLLLASAPELFDLEKCGFQEKLLRHIGLITFTELSALEVVRWVAPEVVIFIMSIFFYEVSYKKNLPPTVKKPKQIKSKAQIEESIEKHKKKAELRDMSQEKIWIELKQHDEPNLFHVNFGKFVVLVSLCITSSIRPSIFGGIYFLTFIFFMTTWSIALNTDRLYMVACYLNSILCALHLLGIFLYQLQYIQESISVTNLFIRLFAMTPYYTMSCEDDPREFIYNAKSSWTVVVNPIALGFLYQLLVIEGKLLVAKIRAKRVISLHKRQNTEPASEVDSKSSSHAKVDRWLSGRTISLVDEDSLNVQGGIRPTHRASDVGTSGRIRKSEVYTSNPILDRANAPDVSPRVKRSDMYASVPIGDHASDHVGVESYSFIEGRSPHEKHVGDQLLSAAEHLIQICIRASYIATNIIMMVWSITYHSWMAFILLIWALMVWMVPDKRNCMLRTSGLLVCYAEFLLVVQYIYGMDVMFHQLTSEESADKLDEIGFEQPPKGVEAYEPILYKSLFTCMFWITLRQYTQERMIKAQNDEELLNKGIEISITVKGRNIVRGRADDAIVTSPIIIKLGEFLYYVMIRSWIWVVAIMLFVCGFTGERMTVFRICYMTLFMIFIMTFQINWKFWRKMMSSFLLTVIIFSMVILILIYTYQFENFPYYWKEYLLVPINLQQDMGLETYRTKQLFFKLATPTFFVIMTVIQLQYLHADFLQITEMRLRNINLTDVRSRTSMRAARRASRSSVTSDEIASKMLTKESRALVNKIKKLLNDIFETLILALEMHLNKIIIFSIMMMCVHDVAAVHIIFVVLIVLCVPFTASRHTATIRLIALMVSALFLMKMIYQIDYIHHSTFSFNCTLNETHAETINIAEWIGFFKATEDRPLADLLKGYIGILVVTTVQAGVKFRQIFKRYTVGKPIRKPYLMFPKIKRADADRGLLLAMKYLANFGFYKFGMEVVLITMVTLIAVRMDIYGLLYSIWLCALFSMPRQTAARIWLSFICFIMFFIPLQYILIVGFQPFICKPPDSTRHFRIYGDYYLPRFPIEYPWRHNSDSIHKPQEYIFLPDSFNNLDPYKLMFDFALLIGACRQKIVFHIEKKYQYVEYFGGSNAVIMQFAEAPGFVNPVPNFFGTIKSWLDIVKRMLFLPLLWITLAFVFLAGTLRVSIFSLGYLIGAFYFLWQGMDLYLRPIPMIINSWNGLLGFNVLTIFLKCILQVIGCIYIETVEENACWLVQLFGIGCDQNPFYFRTGVISHTECVVPPEDYGLAWDAVCFSFLLIQRRLFNSFYFFHVVDEAKAMTMLQSRGADLKDEIIYKEITMQEEEERRIMEKIRQKMDRIRTAQLKLRASSFLEMKRNETHFTAIRSGDYYMFDEFDDADIDLNQPKGYRDDRGESYDTLAKTPSRGIGIGELLTTFVNVSMDEATKCHMQGSTVAKPASLPIMKKKEDTDSSFESAKSNQSAPVAGPSTPKSARGTEVTAKPSRTSATLIKQQHKTELDDEDLSQYSEEDEQEEHKVDFDPSEHKILTTSQMLQSEMFRYGRFLMALVESIMVTITSYIDIYSRDFRFVLKTLAKEKAELKARPDFGKGSRHGYSMMWTPLIPKTSYFHRSLDKEGTDKRSVGTNKRWRKDDDRKGKKRLGVKRLASRLRGEQEYLSIDIENSIEISPVYDYDKGELSLREQPPFFRLIYSIWFLLLSHSDIVVYCVLFLHQIKSANLLSLPLPLMCFFWGTLSVPRPTKTFWVTVIAYTQTIVLIKCMFQFEFMPWNKLKTIHTDKTDPFYPPDLIGIIKAQYYALYDLCLLLVIFFHRAMLKYLGQWKSSVIDEYLESGVYRMEIESKKTRNGAPTGEPTNKPTLDKKVSSSSSSSGSTVFRDVIFPEDTDFDSESDSSPRYSPSYIQHFSTVNNIRSTDTLHMFPKKKLHKKVRLLDPESDAAKSDEERSSDPNDDVDDDGDGDYGGDDDEESHTILVQSTRTDPCSNFPSIILLGLKKYCEPIWVFYGNLFEPTSRVTTNVYAIMFMCDFINFLVIIFGFSSFGDREENVMAYIDENRVPVTFLVVLFIQFMLILLDRALYLRKQIMGKIIFQFFLVILVHGWMFFALPFVTERKFNADFPPQMWYFVKCIYFLYSAFQIRSGYPTRILGNFICKHYNIISRILLTIYIKIPFLFEMRTIMDWIWTNTTFTLFDWLKMEDVFVMMFGVKCYRNFEEQFPSLRGVEKWSVLKYIQGGIFLAVIIAILWFPLVFFAMVDSVGTSNLPTEMSAELRIDSTVPIWEGTCMHQSISAFNSRDMQQMVNAYKRDRVSKTQLSNYEPLDVAAITWSEDSITNWQISEPELVRLREKIEAGHPITVYLRFKLHHDVTGKDHPAVINLDRSIVLEKDDADKLNAVLRRDSDDDTIILRQLFPKFLKVVNKGQLINFNTLMRNAKLQLGRMRSESEWLNPVEQLDEDDIEVIQEYRDVKLHLKGSTRSITRNEPHMWDKTARGGVMDGLYANVNEDCSDPFYEDVLKLLPAASCTDYVVYTFNEKKFPAQYELLNIGIIGLYGTYVIVIWRLVQTMTTGGMNNIWLEEIPSVDRVLQLCLDIYLVRESNEFKLEEDLYSKLVFLFRSPETLVKFTRPLGFYEAAHEDYVDDYDDERLGDDSNIKIK